VNCLHGLCVFLLLAEFLWVNKITLVDGLRYITETMDARSGLHITGVESQTSVKVNAISDPGVIQDMEKVSLLPLEWNYLGELSLSPFACTYEFLTAI